MEIIPKFRVFIDLDECKLTKAIINKDRILSAQDVLVLIFFHNISTNHVKVHAYSNWAVNDITSNNFIRRMSVISVMYNYIGYTGFPEFSKKLYLLGIFPNKYYNVVDIFNHGLLEEPKKVTNLIPLKQYSTTCIYK